MYGSEKVKWLLTFELFFLKVCYISVGQLPGNIRTLKSTQVYYLISSPIQSVYHRWRNQYCKQNITSLDIKIKYLKQEAQEP